MSTPDIEAREAIDLLDRPEAGGAAIRGSGLRGLGYVAITLLGVISAPLLSRHLGVVDFGRYSTVASLVALVGLLTEAGLTSLGMRELAVRGGEDRRSFMRNLIGIRIVLTCAGTAAAVAFAAVAGYGAPLVLGTALAGIGLMTYVAQGTVALPAATQLRLGAVTVSELVRHVVFTLAVVALVVAGAGLVLLLGASIPAGLAGTALMAWLARGGGASWRPAFDRPLWRVILRDTLPIALAGAIYSFYFRLVILLMSILAPGLATGYFALSFRVIEVLVSVPFVMVGALMPLFSRAARDDQARFAYAFGRTFDVALVAGLGLSLLTFVGAPLAMLVLTGTGTGPATEVLRIQSATVLAVFLNVVYGSALIALRQSRQLVVLNAGVLAVTLVVAVPFVELWHARGGAIAATIGEWTLAASYAMLVWRTMPHMRPSLWAAPRAAVAAALALAATAVIHVPVVPNLAAVAIAAVVYVGALLALRGIPSELLDALRRRPASARPAP